MGRIELHLIIVCSLESFMIMILLSFSCMLMDMLIIGHDSSKIDRLKRELSKFFFHERLGISKTDTWYEDLP